MNHGEIPAYGLWGLVIINSAVFILFALSFFKPQTRTDWRSFGDAWRRYAAVTPRFVPRWRTRGAG